MGKPLDSEVDRTLSEIRGLVQTLGMYCAEILVRADGRVTIRISDCNSYLKHCVDADLDPDSVGVPPNAAMHSAFAEWGGR